MTSLPWISPAAKPKPTILPLNTLTVLGFFVLSSVAAPSLLAQNNHLDAADGKPANAVWVDNDGWTGINTTQPEAQLDVRGGAYIQGGNGDANGDGLVNTVDMLPYLRAIDGQMAVTPAEYARMDINGDGRLSWDDFGIMLELAFGRSREEAIRNVERGYGMKTKSTFYVHNDANVGLGLEPNERLTLNGAVSLQIQSTSPNHTGGFGKLYVKNDGRLYYRHALNGSETSIGEGLWTQGSGSSLYYTAGNVAIGGTSPSNRLSVFGNANITGRLGIGLTSPGTALDVDGTVRADEFCIGGDCVTEWAQGDITSIQTNSNSGIFVGGGDSGDVILAMDWDNTQKRVFQECGEGYAIRAILWDGSVHCEPVGDGGGDPNWDENGTHVYNTNTGNVGIGTAAPQAKLDVNGRARVHTLELVGGADLAEPFQVSSETPIEPGFVVAIDPENAGQMRLTQTPYDRTVAGVISGANGIDTGLLLRQTGTVADGEWPVALTGRVYVKVDASHGTVRPGDLLTTSPTPGHAMVVRDHNLAQGAILGKAMTGLDQGKGAVLLLVGLQ